MLQEDNPLYLWVLKGKFFPKKLVEIIATDWQTYPVVEGLFSFAQSTNPKYEVHSLCTYYEKTISWTPFSCDKKLLTLFNVLLLYLVSQLLGQKEPIRVLLSLIMWCVHAKVAKFLFYVLTERFEHT